MRIPSLAVPVFAAGALLTATVVPAAAATNGVGSTTGALTVLSADAGSLLSIDLLSDQGRATTNPANGVPSALAQLLALDIQSAAVGLAQTVPLVKAESTGAEQTQSQGITPLTNPVLGGTLLPVDLSALVNSTGAVSGLDAGLADLSILGGLLQLSATDLGLDANSLASKADGVRALDVDAITVLDLESLLGGLGISLTDLGIDSLLGVIEGLGVIDELSTTLDGLGLGILDGLDLSGFSADDFTSLIDTLRGAVDEVEALVVDLTNTVCDTLDPALDTLDDLLGGVLPVDPCADIPALLTQATDALDDLLVELSTLLDTVLDTLTDLALLRVDGIDVSVVTTATDAVATSVADVSAVLGGITIGGLTLPGLDLDDALSQVNALVTQVEGTLGGVLGTIDPSLADLVDIRLLEKATSVTKSGNSVVADASFVGLGVDILPNVQELLTLLTSLAGLESVGDVLTGLGAPVPTTGSGILDINDALTGLPTSGITGSGGEVLALSEGASIELASISQQSAFTPNATSNPSTTGTLPKTGGPNTMLLLFGGLAVLGALGVRWRLRTVE